MPQRSKIIMLPPEVKDELDRRLVSGSFAGYAGLAEWLQEQGYEISRSAVHRYGQGFGERLAAIKIATEQARAISETVGDDMGQMSDALISLVQEKAFDVLVNLQTDDPEMFGKVFPRLGLMVARLSRASVGQKKWMAETREKASSTADEVVKVAKTGGLSEEKAEEIRRKILGIV